MQVNQIPQQQLQTQLNSASTMLGSYEKLTSDVATLQSVSDTLESPSGWQAWIPDSTTQDATATVGTGAIGGSLTFSVDALAQADSMISSGNVSSESSQVTSGPLLVAAGGGALGIGTLASSNLSVGSHTIAVTQASAGASLTAAGAPAASTTITSGTNDTLDLRPGRPKRVAHHRRRHLQRHPACCGSADRLGRCPHREHQFERGHGAHDRRLRGAPPRSR